MLVLQTFVQQHRHKMYLVNIIHELMQLLLMVLMHYRLNHSFVYIKAVLHLYTKNIPVIDIPIIRNIPYYYTLLYIIIIIIITIIIEIIKKKDDVK